MPAHSENNPNWPPQESYTREPSQSNPPEAKRTAATFGVTEDEFLGIKHTLEKADEDLTGLTTEVRKLQQVVADLITLHKEEVAELRALIHELAGTTKYAELIFERQIGGTDTAEKNWRKFSQGLADIYTKTDPR